MLIERIKGSIDDACFKDKSVDAVSIEWYDSQKKIHRLTSRKGRDIAVRLPDEERSRGLRQGDVLAVVEGDAIVIDIVPSQCLVVSCRSRAELITLCYETGNRHAQFYYMPDGESFAVPYDRPFEELLRKLKLSFVIENTRLDSSRRISAAAGHSHSHTENALFHAAGCEHE